MPVEWAEKWKTVSVLRRSVRDTTGKVFTSLTQASQYNQMANWNRRLGRSFGMKETFEFKMLVVVEFELDECLCVAARRLRVGHGEAGVRDQGMSL